MSEAAVVGEVIKSHVGGLEVKGVKIYEDPIVLAKYELLPGYVGEATATRLKDPHHDPMYDKIFLDKWGRRDTGTNRYGETPELVFYRAATLIADGLVANEASLNREETVEYVFHKFAAREIFPNTPFMANGGHSLVATDLEGRIQGTEDPSQYRVLSADLEQERKVREQLFACFVLGIYDSRHSIFTTLGEAADIQASVGGTGFNWSQLRPGLEPIAGTGGVTDGPVSFMGMYSVALGTTINQGGKRDGANMFMLDTNHPDIMRFIYAKREDGEIPAANMSVAIDHDFMKATQENGGGRYYRLRNPHFNPEERPHLPEFYSIDQLRQGLDFAAGNAKAKVSMLLSEDGTEILSPWLHEGMDTSYKVIGKVGEDGSILLDSHKILGHLSYSAWFNGEPGMIFTGTINDVNPVHPKHYKDALLEDRVNTGQIPKIAELVGEGAGLEDAVDFYINEVDSEGKPVNLPVGIGIIRATNPCGEKPLLPREACVLGHLNLETLVVEDLNDPTGYRFDWEKLEENTRLMYEILDNAIDQNQFTNPEIEVTQKSNRKIGLGFMGLANTLMKLELAYNSDEGREFVGKVLDKWEEISEQASHEKAERFGSYPNFQYSQHRNGPAKRNAIVRTLAPTGTTGFVAKTTGGLEPEYALFYIRQTVQGSEIHVRNRILEEKVNKYDVLRTDGERTKFFDFIEDPKEGNGTIQGFEITKAPGETGDEFVARQERLDKLKHIFVTTYDIEPMDHLRMQREVQLRVDDAISKTTNLRSNVPFGDIGEIVREAYSMGLKGLTIYRDGTRRGQPLKVSRDSVDGPQMEGDAQDLYAMLVPLIANRLKEPRPENPDPSGPTKKVETPLGNLFLTFNFETGEWGSRPHENFYKIGKSGEDVGSITEALGRAVSLGIKAGVSPWEYVEQFEGIGGHSQVGFGPDKVLSVPDAIGKAMREILEERESEDGGESTKPSGSKNNGSGNFCPECRKSLQMQEGCEKCSCGWSKC